MDSANDILCIKGIGEKTAKLFQKIGIHTIFDLLHTYPRDYISYPFPKLLQQISDGEYAAVFLRITAPFQWKKVRNLTIGNVLAADDTGNIRLTFFNMPYLKTRLTVGSSFLFYGCVRIQGNQRIMEQPRLFQEEEYEQMRKRLQPVYGLTKGLTNHMFQKAVRRALENYEQEEFLPKELIEEYGLIDHRKALFQIHFPMNQEEMMHGRERLAFEELFEFLCEMRKLKNVKEESSAYVMLETAGPFRLMEQLPYSLTKAQQRAYKEMISDLTSGFCMNRLIQGDVGSGKTILAFLALLLCVENGFQGAMMAPTEILALQHYEELCNMTKQYNLPFVPVLLTGSMGKRAKQEAYRHIQSGTANVVIGTHALIQEPVEYQKLALVITDEQHRFGVRQREALGQKGTKPHVLVMSATPIPRTLAIILYGDLHVSVVDERPAERLPVKNCVVGTSYRQKAYEFIQKEVRKGRQAYVICPMVEENEDLKDVESVMEYAKSLNERLDDSVRTQVLHGKMRPERKHEIMEQFAKGNIHVLVSTTVIEVGVNVPNATVMLIENAERFGLAQLHQLRGRIGRGSEQSYCIFMSHSQKPEQIKRLQVLNESNDGFYIAEQDLKLRGPGDLFGIRQSGELVFQIADIYQDAQLLTKISRSVDELFLYDPELCMEGHVQLRRHLDEKATKSVDFRSI